MAGSGPIATTPTEAVEHDPLMLYAPIAKQINGDRVPWTIEYPKVSPQEAQVILDAADSYTKIGQRPRTRVRKERWLRLMESDRFVEYLPVGALCFNPDDIVMNGGNRLAALAEFDKPLGFMVIRNCPTWMVKFFDNGNMRSLRESMFINKRDAKPETQATVRLAMRYEEFLFGKRPQYAWVEWSRTKDEHADVDNFMAKREYVLDFIAQAKPIAKRTNLQVASIACFIAYQQLAYPNGASDLEMFLNGLELGAMLDKGHPALTLREWGQKDGYIGGYTHGRREGHLLLLFKFFTMFCEHVKITDVRVAKGLPMSMPYHPDGWDVACKTAREALLDMG